MTLLVVALCAGLFTLCGCIGTIDGKTQAGVPFVKDTIEARYERPFNQVWTASKDVLAFNGTLHVENVIGRTLEAKVDTRTVWVLVEELEPRLTAVLVQVRTKGGGSDLELAGELDKQIAVRLATGNLSPSAVPPRASTNR